jgi:UDP-GlcNAc:undecaprenyl-phosphate GlcNAc-1-phosphate transferase
MGDAGSMLLGLYVAAMMLMFGETVTPAGHLTRNPRWVLGAVMMFGLPILDTSLALLRRIRLHRPIFAGDRSHLYDQLVDRGFTVRQTVAVCYALAAFYGTVGLAVMVLRIRYTVAVYPVVVAGTLYLCHRLGFLQPPVESPRERAGAGQLPPGGAGGRD